MAGTLRAPKWQLSLAAWIPFQLTPVIVVVVLRDTKAQNLGPSHISWYKVLEDAERSDSC